MTMKDEYDFSSAEKGRFYRAGATFRLPVYLNDENRAFVERLAAKKNVDVSTVVNDLLESDRQLVESSE